MINPQTGLISGPASEDRLAAGSLDLLTETVAVKSKQCIVRGIRRTAQRIRREYDAVAEVDGVENGGEHANIGLGSRDDEAVDPTPAQQVP